MFHLDRPVSCRRRGVVVLAALALTAAAGLSACRGQGDDGPPYAVAVPTASPGDAATCARFLDALPSTLAGLDSATVTPSDAPGRAWGRGIVLTCGVGVPAGFTDIARCDSIRGVGWYVPSDEYADENSPITATAVGYRPRVSVRVPADYRGQTSFTVLSALAGPIRAHLRDVQPCH